MHDAVKVSNESPYRRSLFSSAIEIDVDVVSDGQQVVRASCNTLSRRHSFRRFSLLAAAL